MTINAGQYIQWDAVPGAIEYDAELLNAAAGAVLKAVTSEDTEVSSVEILEGQPHGNYNFRVRATDAVGPGAWSILVPIEFNPLPAPGNIRVS